MIYWHYYIYLNTKLSISCGDPPHLEHPKTLHTHTHTHIYIYWSWFIDITKFIWTQNYQSAVEAPALRTYQDITLKWSLDITLFIWTQRYQLAVGTRTLRTSQNISHIYFIIYWHNYIYMNKKLSISCGQDIATHICIYKFLQWSIDITLLIRAQSYQSAVETPTLRTSQDITTCIYI